MAARFLPAAGPRVGRCCPTDLKATQRGLFIYQKRDIRTFWRSVALTIRRISGGPGSGERAAGAVRLWAAVRPMPVEVLIKTLSIKNDYEFRRAYKKGRPFVNAVVVIYILKNKKGVNRVGITTSRKIGGAVERNRARRIIREAYHSFEDKLPKGYDIVFVARTRTCSIKMQSLQRVMGGIFSSAKLIEKKTQ